LDAKSLWWLSTEVFLSLHSSKHLETSHV
jgi:hypothetical protein